MPPALQIPGSLKKEAIPLATPVDRLPGGTRYRAKLARLGIHTVRDLLFHIPHRYEQFGETLPIAQVRDMIGQRVAIAGTVGQIENTFAFRRRMMITEAVIADGTASIRIVWFGQPYLENTLPPGTPVRLAGKVSITRNGVFLSNPSYEKDPHSPQGKDSPSDHPIHTGGLVSVYPETAGISSRYLRFLIKPLFGRVAMPDPLPPALVEKYDLVDLETALHGVHFPETMEQADRGRRRLAFDEILHIQLRALTERRRLIRLKAAPIPFDRAFVAGRIKRLPFTLTKDQKVALWEILKDIGRAYPMNRLLEGDVGSGKTVVALLAALQAARAGRETMYMAPTEILAHQHYRTMTDLAGDAMRFALLTGSSTRIAGEPVSKKALTAALRRNEIDLIVGTHALLQDGIAPPRLALVVIDEQHRFGTAQRAALVRPNVTAGTVPHLLSMTATPIPRTLALTLYGDLDISIIREKPANRAAVATAIVPPSGRAKAYQKIDREIASGRQAFVVCPRVEATGDQPAPADTAKLKLKQKKLDEIDAKTVEEEYLRLASDVFPGRRIAKLHGRMKPKEKESVMREFKDGWYDILVSTSVIEVGVDVPNASVMVVENADRFGLAQLHQFRGRVGRAEHASYCFLFASSEDHALNKRLQALIGSSDGFALAEQDLKIRGPGEFFGARQSGMPDFVMASLADVDLIKRARLAARTILKDDPSLKQHPLLREQITRSRGLAHRE